jgi:hypothetical protein
MARFTTVHGIRVVAAPVAVEAVAGVLAESVTALRFAPDDLFLIGYRGLPPCSDPHAIVATDLGYSGAWFARAEFEAIVRPHMEWQMPSDGRLGQGLVAGVPAKVHVDGDTVFVMCPSAFVHELKGRLL